jgi:hypothetical protein
MLRRPIILKIFAIFLFLDPLLRVCLMSIEREFTFFEVINKTLELSLNDFCNFWFLFPISGLLLLGVKVYSYILFIIIQFYSLYFHLNYESYSWPYLAKTPSTTAYLLLMINLFMVIYLLMPRSREIFFNKDLRWWERGSRFTINEPCFLKVGSSEIHGKVCDLSFGGALLELDQHIDTGHSVELEFEILTRPVSLQASVIRLVQVEGVQKYGVQFIFKNWWDEIRLKLLMLSLSKVGNYDQFR